MDWNGQHYEYDRLNKMTRSCATWNVIAASCSAQDWLHVYTADDERMWQYRIGVAGSLFTLRGLDRKVLRTYDSSQGVNAFTDAIWANGKLFATATSAGAVAHWHTDELGTPIVQTNAAGGAQASYAYFPYGEEINQSVVDPARFRFTAHERDLGTQPGTADDRDYMHQRSTLPQLGRFLSVDPIGGNPFNPQSWNRFTYALNNPLKYMDPFGLDENGCGTDGCITVTGGFGPGVPFGTGGLGNGDWLWNIFNGGPALQPGFGVSLGAPTAPDSTSPVRAITMIDVALFPILDVRRVEVRQLLLGDVS